jgi:conjugative relaxase-like TrwC/TraI family protein
VRRGSVVVLSIGKLSPGRADYYLDTVAKGAEEYYVGSGEAPGRWVGRGAEHLGLSGGVDGRDLRAVLTGHDLLGKSLLAPQGPKRMPGYDCTFNAPKSVTLLFALGSPETRRQMREAHEAAVDAALAVLEEEACRVRRGRGGAHLQPGEGFVAAAFRHRTSRSGDPHLHTHVVIANLARSERDGRWTTLDGRQLYAWCRTVGFLYEAHLRAELTDRLGVGWGPIRNGISDIRGVPRRVIEHFSQRRRQIVDRMADIGSLGGHAAQVAAYATRQTKDTSVPYTALRNWWVERAAALGFDQEALEAVCGITARQRPARDDIDQDELFRRLDAPDGLTKHRATFDRRDVIRQVCAELTHGADVDDVLGHADEYLASRHVIPLAETGSHRIRRADGRSAPIPTDGHRWTTPDMLRVERNLIQMAGARRSAGAGLAKSTEIARAVAERPTLSSEQQTMVQRICGSGDGVEVVPGIAGSGKTFALAAAHDAWEASGLTVVGVALSAQAARQLETGSGIPSATIARFQRDLARPGHPGLSLHHVLVIDEAAMVGTRALVDLVSRVHRAGAKAVLIGDACQLPEIDAGGAFAGLSRRSRPASLTNNGRQHEPWERQALADLRLGHAPEALAAYEAHDRIHHMAAPGRAVDAMVDRWWDVTGDSGDALILAARHDAVRDLNDRARRRMGDAGRLDGTPVELGGREYSVGDQVLGLSNDYRIGILNGTRATVAAIEGERSQLLLTITDGRSLAVPFAYAEAGHLAHGYAMTIHKAQGATCDHALVLVDETMSREAIYTAMSRGRYRNDLYLTAYSDRDDIAHAPEMSRDAIDALMVGIERSAAQQMAIESDGLSL